MTIDGHRQVLLIPAHSARAATAQLVKHRAVGKRNGDLKVVYDTAGGGRIDVHWGRATVSGVGDLTAWVA